MISQSGKVHNLSRRPGGRTSEAMTHKYNSREPKNYPKQTVPGYSLMVERMPRAKQKKKVVTLQTLERESYFNIFNMICASFHLVALISVLQRKRVLI